MVEVMISAALGSVILMAVISMFLFIGRSGANLANYSEMEAQARNGLEYFAQDTRQASEMTWNSASSITLTVNGATIVYSFDSSASEFSRRAGGIDNVLIQGINTFVLDGYMITGAKVNTTDLTTAAKRDAASGVTKQLQIYLKSARTSSTVNTATNTVLSARYILRNKRVTT
jgi:Tfp pilus assembly protein PilW